LWAFPQKVNQLLSNRAFVKRKGEVTKVLSVNKTTNEDKIILNKPVSIIFSTKENTIEVLEFEEYNFGIKGHVSNSSKVIEVFHKDWWPSFNIATSRTELEPDSLKDHVTSFYLKDFLKTKKQSTDLFSWSKLGFSFVCKYNCNTYAVIGYADDVVILKEVKGKWRVHCAEKNNIVFSLPYKSASSISEIIKSKLCSWNKDKTELVRFEEKVN
jgi:hypothetical protein